MKKEVLSVLVLDEYVFVKDIAERVNSELLAPVNCAIATLLRDELIEHERVGNIDGYKLTIDGLVYRTILNACNPTIDGIAKHLKVVGTARVAESVHTLRARGLVRRKPPTNPAITQGVTYTYHPVEYVSMHDIQLTGLQVLHAAQDKASKFAFEIAQMPGHVFEFPGVKTAVESALIAYFMKCGVRIDD